MKLSILTLAGGRPVLSGVQAGRQLFGKLVAAARPPAEPEPAYLDFDGVTCQKILYPLINRYLWPAPSLDDTA